jgi:hypothetical protein
LSSLINLLFSFDKNKEKITPFTHINACFFANNIGESAPNTFNISQRIHHFLSSINIRVQNTQNVLKIFFFVVYDKRLKFKK